MALSLAAAWPVGASAYRPFTGTDASVTAKGDLEIEFGPLGYLVEGPDKALVTSVILNWGFVDRWEAVLEGRQFVRLGSAVTEPRFRVDDTAFSLKVVLREGTLQEKTGPSIATEFGALLPTINGEPGVGAIGALIISQRWTDLTVHVNGGATWTRAHTPGVFGALILEGHDAWTVRPVAEVFVEHERDLPTAVSGLIGTIWRASDRLSFDAAVVRGRTLGVNTTELRAGLTWDFSVGFPK
jgi:hypothetical protein